MEEEWKAAQKTYRAIFERTLKDKQEYMDLMQIIFQLVTYKPRGSPMEDFLITRTANWLRTYLAEKVPILFQTESPLDFLTQYSGFWDQFKSSAKILNSAAGSLKAHFRNTPSMSRSIPLHNSANSSINPINSNTMLGRRILSSSSPFTKGSSI